MKVGVIGPTGVDDFAWNIAAGLRALSVEAVLLGSMQRRPNLGPLTRPTAEVLATASRQSTHGWRLGQHLERRARAEGLDLAITVESLHPTLVTRLRDAGTEVVMWFPDHVSNLGALWMFAAPYSHLFFKEPLLVDRIRNLLDLPISYLPEACNPQIHTLPESTTKRRAIAVVGNYYATRVRLLDRLIADGFPLELYGGPLPSWNPSESTRSRHTGRYVVASDKAAVFRSCAGVLNNLHPAEISGVNCRLFEAAACGGAVVCEYRNALPDLFELGTEVESFTTYDELTAVLTRLLDDPDRSLSVGNAAHWRAITNHTYEARLTEMFGVIGRALPTP